MRLFVIVSLVALLSSVVVGHDQSSSANVRHAQCRRCVRTPHFGENNQREWYQWCPSSNSPARHGNSDAHGSCLPPNMPCFTDPVYVDFMCPNDAPEEKLSCNLCVQDSYIWCQSEMYPYDEYSGYCVKENSPSSSSSDRPHPPHFSSSDRPHPPHFSSSDRPHPPHFSSSGRPHPPFSSSEHPHPPHFSSSDRPRPPPFSSSGRPQPPFSSSGRPQPPRFSSSFRPFSMGARVESVAELDVEGPRRPHRPSSTGGHHSHSSSSTGGRFPPPPPPTPSTGGRFPPPPFSATGGHYPGDIHPSTGTFASSGGRSPPFSSTGGHFHPSTGTFASSNTGDGHDHRSSTGGFPPFSPTSTGSGRSSICRFGFHPLRQPEFCSAPSSGSSHFYPACRSEHWMKGVGIFLIVFFSVCCLIRCIRCRYARRMALLRQQQQQQQPQQPHTPTPPPPAYTPSASSVPYHPVHADVHVVHAAAPHAEAVASSVPVVVSGAVEGMVYGQHEHHEQQQAAVVAPFELYNPARGPNDNNNHSVGMAYPSPPVYNPRGYLQVQDD